MTGGNFSQSMQGGAAKKKDKMTLWQKDIFIFRYKDNKDQDHTPGHIKVLQNKQFLEIIAKNKSGGPWANIELIQTCIKADGGCGDPVMIHFHAPLDLKNPEIEINYNYKEMENDMDLL